MPTVLDDPAAELASSAPARMRMTMAAVRVMFTWLGTRKTLTPDQKSQAADSFGAEREYPSAGKKLLDVSHPAFKAVTGVRSRIQAYWKGISLPYPEPGIRLIRQDDIASFTVQLTTLKKYLQQAVTNLDECYAELKSAARRRLGRLFNVADYVRSNDQLDDLVAQAQRVIRGVQPQQLRDNVSLRQQVASQLSGVQAVLDGLLVDRPRRNIVRRAK